MICSAGSTVDRSLLDQWGCCEEPGGGVGAILGWLLRVQS